MYRLRFDMRAPDRTPEQIARLYEAALAMSAWADDRGCEAIAISEHHASADGYLPSPLTMAAAVAAVTSKVPIMVAAALLPLYDPVRLAEEMVVLDHLSRGRVVYVLGVGYRPEEYELYGQEFRRRGATADDKLAALLSHLRAAREASAATRVTPPPFSSDGPMIFWGGSTTRAAERAGRHGLGLLAQTGDPGLRTAYEAAAAAAGHEPGLCFLPSPDAPASVFVAADVDEGWREVGDALLADATTYYAWNEAAGLAESTVSLTKGGTVEELRAANGSHRVVSVPEAVELIRRDGALGLQPLCGGLDPDVAWPYLRRVVDEVLRDHRAVGMPSTPIPYRARATTSGVLVAETASARRVDVPDAAPELWLPREDVVEGALTPGLWRAGSGDLAAHVAFDHEQVRLELVDGMADDDPPT